MKKYFKLFSKHKQKVYFSIEPDPRYTSEPGNNETRWEVWKEEHYHWELIGTCHTLAQGHEIAHHYIKRKDIDEYEIETFGIKFA